MSINSFAFYFLCVLLRHQTSGCRWRRLKGAKTLVRTQNARPTVSRFCVLGGCSCQYVEYVEPPQSKQDKPGRSPWPPRANCFWPCWRSQRGTAARRHRQRHLHCHRRYPIGLPGQSSPPARLDAGTDDLYARDTGLRQSTQVHPRLAPLEHQTKFNLKSNPCLFT